jgi:hypothetical protein
MAQGKSLEKRTSGESVVVLLNMIVLFVHQGGALPLASAETVCERPRLAAVVTTF